MDQLAQPVALLMRPTFTVDLRDSLEVAARKLRENGCDLLPVTDEGLFAGAITEVDLTHALAAGREASEGIDTIVHGAITAQPSTTGAEALRLFDSQGASTLVVIDDSARVLGVLTPSDLYPKRIVPLRPPLVGGMATPFGVYLTTGSMQAGVSPWALVTTGMTLNGLLIGGAIVGSLASDSLAKHGAPDWIVVAIQGISPFIALLGMRLLPLSGIHAAEHKVVHAIERGEDLIPSIVRRMPRVHPRCGTNLAVGASIFMGVMECEFIPTLELRVLLGALATLLFWRRLGNLVQRYVTTKPPTEKQIEMGIRSGKELLKRYSMSPTGSASIGKRIYFSGIFHVIVGSAIVLGLALLIGSLLHYQVF